MWLRGIYIDGANVCVEILTMIDLQKNTDEELSDDSFIWQEGTTSEEKSLFRYLKWLLQGRT